MVTCYRNNGRDLRYECTRDQVNRGGPRCQSLSGGALDELVAGLVLEVLRPSAGGGSLQLAEGGELERGQPHPQGGVGVGAGGARGGGGPRGGAPPRAG